MLCCLSSGRGRLQDNIKQALLFLRAAYGDTPAREFTPRFLVAVRQVMIDAGRCRPVINKDVNRIRQLFRWAVEHELVPGAVLQALRAMTGLSSVAPKPKPLRPLVDEGVK